MNPLNFYIHPDKLDYEKDVDPVGREMIRQINRTDYLRTTMYCSGHFPDEQEYPWMKGQLNICLVALDNQKAYPKLDELVSKLKNVFGWSGVHGGYLYLYIDRENNNKEYMLSNIIVEYGNSKSLREKAVNMIMEVLR
jgi:hypothetical protein